MTKPRDEWRHLALLISVLFLFVVTPVAAMFPHGVLLMDVVAVLVLVTGSWSLSESRHLFAAAIVPHSATAQTLAALEAVTGQIYLTVLVARLVGLHIVHAHSFSSRKE